MQNNYNKIDFSKVYVRCKGFVFSYFILIFLTILMLSWSLLITDIVLFCFLHPSARVYYIENGKKKKIIVSKYDWKNYRETNNISTLNQFSYIKINTALKIKTISERKDELELLTTADIDKPQVIHPTHRVDNQELDKSSSKIKLDEKSTSNIKAVTEAESKTILNTTEMPELEATISNLKIKAPQEIKKLQYVKERIHKLKNITPLPTLSLDNEEENSLNDLPEFSYSSNITSNKQAQYIFEINKKINVLITNEGNYDLDSIEYATPYNNDKNAGLAIKIEGHNQDLLIPISTWNSKNSKKIYFDLKQKLSSVYKVIEQNNQSKLPGEKFHEYLELKDTISLSNFENGDFGIDKDRQSIFINQLYRSNGYKIVKFADISEIIMDNKLSLNNDNYILSLKIETNQGDIYHLYMNKYTTPSFDLEKEKKLENSIYQNLKNICNKE